MEITIIVMIAGAIVAGFVQGLAGFGFGMVAISFWAWVLDPPLAAALSVFGSLSGQLLAATTVRRGFNLQLLWPFLAGGLLGVPIGVAILPLLDVQVFKALLGIVLVIWCPIMLYAQRLPPLAINSRIMDAVVGTIGGIMGGLGGFTGTAPSLWCVLRQLEKDTQRAILQNFNLGMLTVTMISYLSMGIITHDMLPKFAIILPAMLIPTFIGMRLYFKISERSFRMIVLGLLTASGVALLFAALPGLLAR